MPVSPILGEPAGPGTAQRVLRFGLVGASGVAVNLAVLGLLIEVAGWHTAMAGAIAIEVSTVTNWAFNRAWTWRDRDRSLVSVIGYHAVSFVGLIAQWGVLTTAAVFLGVHWMPASLAGIAVGAVWNFIVNHRFTFQPYTAERRRRHLRVAAYTGAAVLHVALAAVMAHDWDVFVFQRSVEDFLLHGTTPYETGDAAPTYAYASGLPIQALWYAYPPLPLLLMGITYAPAVFGLVASPWLGRILVKAPFLAGNLLLAWSAHRLVATGNGPQAAQRARRVELLLLFNPLIVAIGVIWGQFESLLTAVLVLSVIALRSGRHGVAGAAWGTALLLKPFAILVAPLLLVHMVRTSGLPSAVRYFAAGTLVFGAVSLPFWLLQPDGFLQQVFIMHAERPPGRLAPGALLYQAAVEIGRQTPGMLPEPAVLAEAIGLMSLLLTAFVVLMVAAASLRHSATDRNLVLGMALTLAAGLLTSKVLNEQYAVMPLALTLVAMAHPSASAWADAASRQARGLLLTASILMPIALLVDTLHFIRFLPEDVLQEVAGSSAPGIIAAMAAGLGVTVGQLHVAASLIAAALLLPVLINAVAFAAPAVVSGFGGIWDTVLGVVTGDRARRTGLRVGLIASIGLIVLPSVAIGGMAPRTEPPDAMAGVVDGQMIVAEYGTHWFNPLHRPSVPVGPWVDVHVKPEAGYYQPNAKKYRDDIATLRDAGFDAVLIRFQPGFENEAATVARVAEASRMPHALEVDLRDLAPEDGGLPLTASTAEAARQLFDGPGVDYWRPGWHLRDSPEAGNIVVVHGAEAVGAAYTEAAARWVAEQSKSRGGSESDRQVFAPQAPETAAEMDAATVEAAAWREAYAVAKENWWSMVLGFGGNETRIDLVVDAPLAVPASLHHRVRVIAVLDLDDQPRHDGEDPAFVRVVKAPPGDLATYDESWAGAVSADARMILVPWNAFASGSGIEPTMEHGRTLLLRTQAWTDACKALGPPAADLVPLLPLPDKGD